MTGHFPAATSARNADRLARRLRNRFVGGLLAAGLACLPFAASSQTITTVAGQYVLGGMGGLSGDGGAANAAQVRFPSGTAEDSKGNLYIADSGNHAVRKVTRTGGAYTTITTIAGKKDASGAPMMGYSGDGGLATEAMLAFPSAVAVDPFDNVYIADTGNHRIRKIGTDGKISTIAGAVDSGGNPVAGSATSGSKASTAALYYPSGVAVSPSSLDVYVADTYNHVIRKVSPFADLITTVAGTGTAGYVDSTASASQFKYPMGIAFDSEARLYIADTGNNRVRRFEELYDGVDTVAGNGAATGSLGDGGQAVYAMLNGPASVAVDSADNLYVADFGNNRIRHVSTSASRLISTVAGGGAVIGEGGDPLAAMMVNPRAVSVDKSAGLALVSDSADHLVRSVGIGAGVAVLKGGNGSGTVTSDVGGINCGTTCFRSVAAGTVVTLTASAAQGSAFLGWVGAGCSGTATCQLTAAAASQSEVYAYFTVTGQALLSNLSTRGPVLTGNDVMIGGFAISGSAPKKVLIVTRGPSLANFGVTGVLANPKVDLYSGQTLIASNDDWKSNSASVQSEITASGVGPSNDLESAILTTLNPGTYTAVVTGVNSGTGEGIDEVYQRDTPESPLVNLSTRGKVESADRVMIGGFVIEGTLPRQVLITARGPSLAAFGITNPLSDPKIDLYSGQTLIATNDNWGTNANAADITATGVGPQDAKESALLMTLNPGAYTAVVSGVGGVTGVAIVEVFAR